MEINIVADEEPRWSREGTYTVRVGGKFTITTTVAEEGNTVKQWIHHINKIYGKKGGGRRSELVVGLRGDRSMYYAGHSHYCDGNKGKKDEDVAFDLLQLCVGSHCLLFFDVDHWNKKEQNLNVKSLTEFFWDPKNTFVGVGIEKIAKKIERFSNGVVIRKRVELSELAAEKGYLNQDNQVGGGGGGRSCGGGGGGIVAVTVAAADAETMAVEVADGSDDNGSGGGGRRGGRDRRNGGGGGSNGGGAEETSRSLRRYGLSELAKTVLGEEINFVKPTKNLEYGEPDFCKYATAEVFLASQVGAKLLNNPHSMV